MISLSCPSKTFLLGEYLALKGGPSLILGTEPRFSLSLKKGSGKSPFHPDSPAGKLWTREETLTRNLEVSFENSRKIQGAGSSSAEFLMLFTSLQLEKAIAVEAQLEPDLNELLTTYRELAQTGGVIPSGADLVGQLKGQVTFFDRSRGHLETRGWGFDDLSFSLFLTGQKIPTHEHLAQLPEWNELGLQKKVEEGIQAWTQHQSEAFVESICAVRSELRALGFEHPRTTEILEEASQIPGVLSAKGCGAWGADVILVVTKKQDRFSVQQALSRRLLFLADETLLTEGLSLAPESRRSEEILL